MGVGEDLAVLRDDHAGAGRPAGLEAQLGVDVDDADVEGAGADEPLLEEPEPFALEPPEPVPPFSVEPLLADPVPLPVSPPEGAAGVRGARGAGAVAALDGAVAVELSRRAEDTGMAIAAPSAAAPIASATLPKMLPRRRGGWGCGPAPGATGGS